MGVLHDVCEDCGVSIADLRARGYPERVLAALDALTRREGEDYLTTYIDRVKANTLARKVKLADLADNMDVRRLRVVDAAACVRLEKYPATWVALNEEKGA